MNFYMIFNALIGTFFGGVLAFVSSLEIEKNRRKKEFEDNFKKLLLFIRNNHKTIERIKHMIDNNSISLENKHDAIFGRYNYNYFIYPVNALFTDIQAHLHTKYRNINIKLDYDTSNSFYSLFFEIVRMQSIIVDLQENPVKSVDTSSKEKIIKAFGKFYNYYIVRYNKVFTGETAKKVLSHYKIDM